MQYMYMQSEGMAASCLVCWSLDQVVKVQALVKDHVLCSLVRHITQTVPLTTHAGISLIFSGFNIRQNYIICMYYSELKFFVRKTFC